MYVYVFVTPGAKREKITTHSNTEFEISVREPAERNLANRRVRELIAEAFTQEVGSVRMISGHRSKKKILSVEIDAVS